MLGDHPSHEKVNSWGEASLATSDCRPSMAMRILPAASPMRMIAVVASCFGTVCTSTVSTTGHRGEFGSSEFSMSWVTWVPTPDSSAILSVGVAFTTSISDNSGARASCFAASTSSEGSAAKAAGVSPTTSTSTSTSRPDNLNISKQDGAQDVMRVTPGALVDGCVWAGSIETGAAVTRGVVRQGAAAVLERRWIRVTGAMPGCELGKVWLKDVADFARSMPWAIQLPVLATLGQHLAVLGAGRKGDAQPDAGAAPGVPALTAAP
mmetsp:Transcript_41631/g.86969  ORF Transcript_41631/g.86969 Transcript_41631/m.86969 type:complete len:265 (+) Transcript_41631:775-1569(+)